MMADPYHVAAWRDESEYGVCRRKDCRSLPRWRVASDNGWRFASRRSAKPPHESYEDNVCGRHLMAYLSDFAIEGHYGSGCVLTYWNGVEG